MQTLPTKILEESKKEKMKKLEFELKNFIVGSQIGEMIECPRCHYISKNKRFSCKVFENAIKCFACGLWRRI